MFVFGLVDLVDPETSFLRAYITPAVQLREASKLGRTGAKIAASAAVNVRQGTSSAVAAAAAAVGAAALHAQSLPAAHAQA